MRGLGTILLGATLLTGCGKNAPPAAGPGTSSSTPEALAAKREKDAENAQRLRELTMATPPAKLGIKKSDDFPRIYAVLMDWPIGSGNIASIIGMCDGNASLYTNSTFGIIGGINHELVRQSAIQLVKTAERFYADSVSTSGFPYPSPDRIRFYLATFDGARVIDADLNATSHGQSKFSELFNDGQKLLTALRMTAEKKAA